MVKHWQIWVKLLKRAIGKYEPVRSSEISSLRFRQFNEKLCVKLGNWVL
jgi:hypothetical protein